jgi:hypothetical protein
LPTPEQALQEAVAAKAGIDRLLYMTGVENVENGFAFEEELLRRQANEDHAAIYGGAGQVSTQPESEDVGNKYMVAGNMSVTTMTPQEKAAVVAAVQSSGWLPKLAVAAAMLFGGSGLGYILNDLLGGDPAAVTDTDTDTDTVVELDFAE